MRRSRACAAVPLVALVALAGCGGDHSSGPAKQPDRTMDLTMADHSYAPDRLQVTKGETVRFRFRNTGSVRHEAVIGDEGVQARHHDEMTAATGGVTMPPKDGHGHQEDASSITVEPGQTGEMTHTFEQGGTVYLACHEPGHWEAGMKSTIQVG